MFLNQKPLIACPHCDLLMEKFAITYGQKAHCPRCHTVLGQPIKRSLEYTFALSLTGLLLFIPANTEPVLSLNLLGLTQEATIFSGIVQLFNSGLWLIAGLVLLSALVVPLINLLLILYVSLSLSIEILLPHVTTALRIYQHLEEWAMLEVYMLGILVSLIKLMDTADVVFGTGLYCFVGLLFTSVAISSHIDHEDFWEHIEHLQT
jgi:paraquat-inducible protein A